MPAAAPLMKDQVQVETHTPSCCITLNKQQHWSGFLAPDASRIHL